MSLVYMYTVTDCGPFIAVYNFLANLFLMCEQEELIVEPLLPRCYSGG